MKRQCSEPGSSPTKKRRLLKDYSFFQDPGREQYIDTLTPDSTDDGYIVAEIIARYPQRDSKLKFRAKLAPPPLSASKPTKCWIVFQGSWIDAVRVTESQLQIKEKPKLALIGCALGSVDGAKALVFDEGVIFEQQGSTGTKPVVYNTWRQLTRKEANRVELRPVSPHPECEPQSPSAWSMIDELEPEPPEVQPERPRSSTEQQATGAGVPQSSAIPAGTVLPPLEAEDDEWFDSPVNSQDPDLQDLIRGQLETPPPPPVGLSTHQDDSNNSQAAAGSLPTPKSTPDANRAANLSNETEYPLSSWMAAVPPSQLDFNKLVRKPESTKRKDAPQVSKTALGSSRPPTHQIGYPPEPDARPKQQPSSSTAHLPEAQAQASDINSGSEQNRRSKKKQAKKKRQKLNKQQAAKSIATSSPSKDVQSTSTVVRIGNPDCSDRMVVRTKVPITSWPSGHNDGLISDPREPPKQDAPSECGAKPTARALEVPNKPYAAFTSANKVVCQTSSSTATGKTSHIYTPLKEVVDGALCNIVGLVTDHKGIKTTSTGDLCLTLSLRDSSLRDSYSTFNCFQKQDKAMWLPQVKTGEVLVLHNAKGTVNRRAGSDQVPLTGYWDRLQWVTYSPKDGKFHHGQMGKGAVSSIVHKSHSLGTPYLEWSKHPDTLTKCLEIADWADNGQENVLTRRNHPPVYDAPRIVYDLATNKAVEEQKSYTAKSSVREHRLISEVTPDTKPNGFFDCTVEVLSGRSQGGAYTLSVTDYTQPQNSYSIKRDNAPEELKDLIFDIECNDRSTASARSLEAGAFYMIGNCRMVNRKGHYEGRLMEPKIEQVYSENRAANPHLDALLKRKAAIDNVEAFPHRLFSGISREGFICCTVELLFKYKIPDSDTWLIFVTDYTTNDRLPEAKTLDKTNASWAAGLDRRILKILLSDVQAQMAPKLQCGAIYSIMNVRIREDRSSSAKEWTASLGGKHRAFQRMNEKEMADETQVLKENKSRWQSKQPCKPGAPSTANEDSDETNTGGPVLDPKSIPQDCLDLHDAVVQSLPDKFKIHARVIDIEFEDLRDCSKRYCLKCHRTIKERLKEVCPTCKSTCPNWMFAFNLTVEDSLTRIRFPLVVAIADKKVPLFKHLTPGNLYNEFQFSQFDKALRSILGDQRAPEEGPVSCDNSGWMVYTVVKPQGEALGQVYLYLWDAEKP